MDGRPLLIHCFLSRVGPNQLIQIPALKLVRLLSQKLKICYAIVGGTSTENIPAALHLFSIAGKLSKRLLVSSVNATF